MFKHTLIGKSYKHILKPILFKVDAEKVHDTATKTGTIISKHKYLSFLTSMAFDYKDHILNHNIWDINFENPIGLAAGFDYDGHLAQVLNDVGFGFNTVGTVTAKPYEGNQAPRLGRLPESKALLVNKGFKSAGVDEVIKTLDYWSLDNHTMGVSVGSTNSQQVNTIPKAIEDYVYSFSKLNEKKYIKYFELNISCPNSAMNESFAQKNNYIELLTEVNKLNIKKPIWIKMANELTLNDTSILVRAGINKGISGFVFSNLVKDRNNRFFNRAEIERISNLKGNFSGKPTEENANRLIHNMYKEYGREIKIIGCGGVFSAKDAYIKIKLGASLVQLISGLVYEGPQLIGQINHELANLLRKDGYTNISQAIGKGI